MADGSPQITPVWVDVEPDGSHIIINTNAGNLKLKNIGANPQVAVSVVDKDNPWRFAIVRGTVVEQTTEGADEHIDKLAQKYLGQAKYPWHQPGRQRVILRIKPHHVMERGVS
jgi:PPOX class probable F420-dependent enzyme